MAAATRVYCITLGREHRLVRSYSPAAALAHVARSVAEVHVATQDDLIELLPEHEVEDATRDAVDGEPLLVDGGTASI